jgi:hypothetical protein
MTARKFKDRMVEHRDYPKQDVETEPSGEPFNKPGHADADLKGQVLEKVNSKDSFILQAREAILIKKI